MQGYCAARLLCCAHLATERSALAVLPTSTYSRLAAGPHLPAEAAGPARNVLPASISSRIAGFSLLEVLVAFVILALVGTALFQLFGGALNNASLADDYSRAVLLAESQLANAAVEGLPLREGSNQGNTEDGKYSWTTRIEPYIAPGTTADQERLGQSSAVRLWRISVTVSWPGALGNQRSLSLATVRLASRQPS